MRSGAKNSNEEEDYGEEEQDATQNGKESDSKATATRSKHSVTEQKRRSKINERYQQLRGLIPQPNSEQKKDTASFLLEVIDYVQYLQGELQKYEGTYQPWNSEPTKLMPWRNSHWRTQGTSLRPLDNGIGPGYPENFNETTQSMLLGHLHEFSEPDALSNPTSKAMDQQMHMPMQTLPNASENDTLLSHHLQQPISDSQSADPPLAAGALSQPDGLAIQSGTISISSAYSQGLLNTLKDALQRAGVDLSQAHISVQIDLGKRANRGPAATENYNNLPSTHPPPSTSIEDMEQAQKRLKTLN